MLFRSFNRNKLICRQFHTSSPRHVSPLVWIFLKPVLKGVAWLTGRSTRKWYRQLPPEKRSIFTQHLYRHKYKYIGIFGTIGVTAAVHYYTHLETVPITGRKRYMVVNADKLQAFFDLSKENTAKEHFQQVLSEESKQTQLVARVARRIIASNMDIPCVNTIKWSVRVIDTEIENAFVLPSGDIYFFRGWLEKMKNEDQIAIVLGHELSHAILGHSGEKVSYLQIVDILAIFGAFVIWTVFPSDWTSFCVNYIFEKFITLSARLPYSRRLEEEADAVGLMLAAKACYDVRESVNIWQTDAIFDNDRENSDFFQTHPSNAKRAETLNDMVPWALNIRLQCNCSPLRHKKSHEASNISKNPEEKIMKSSNKRAGAFRHISVVESMTKES